jgi:hypothetical protein
MTGRPKHYIEVGGFGIGDLVQIKSTREKMADGVRGVVTGIARGPELAPYFRVRITPRVGSPSISPWFLWGELSIRSRAPWNGEEGDHAD